MIGIVAVYDTNETMVDMFQIEISSIPQKKYTEMIAGIKKSEPEIRNHIVTELSSKYSTEHYWICNIFTDMMNYLYCFDND